MSVAVPVPPPVPPLGKRERNKAEKLVKIRAAARALFVERGYSGATLRDVAALSGVGFGTLFDYGTDKRDLLFLVFTPELYAALDEGCEAAAQEAALIEQLMRVFESYYALYAREPGLSRDFLRELNFYSDGLQARLFLEQRAEFMRRLVTMVRDGAGEGVVRPQVDAGLAGQLLLSTFAWEVRRWLSVEPLDLAAGLARLRALLELQLRGLAA